MSPGTDLRITGKGKRLLNNIWKLDHQGPGSDSDRDEARFGLLLLLSEDLEQEPDFTRSLGDLSSEINAGGQEAPSNQVIAQMAESLVRSGHIGIALSI